MKVSKKILITGLVVIVLAGIGFVAQSSKNGSSVKGSETSQTKQVAQKVASKEDESSKKQDTPVAMKKLRLMFFMNPNGRPCRMQDGIIINAGKAITDLADIVYVKTSSPNDRNMFYQYGIRALPSLIIADSDGKPIRRFAPGIQSADVIINELSKAKK